MIHLTNNSNYLRRIVISHVIEAITPLGDDQLFKEISLPALKALSSDPIPNVRLSVSRVLFEIIPLLKSQNWDSLTEIKGTLLLQLQQDSDFDVQYFAQKALAY